MGIRTAASLLAMLPRDFYGLYFEKHFFWCLAAILVKMGNLKIIVIAHAQAPSAHQREKSLKLGENYV